MVELHRLIVSVIVREIAAGHDHRIRARHEFGQRHAQRAARIVTLVSHDDGHKLELPQVGRSL